MRKELKIKLHDSNNPPKTSLREFGQKDRTEDWNYGSLYPHKYSMPSANGFGESETGGMKLDDLLWGKKICAAFKEIREPDALWPMPQRKAHHKVKTGCKACKIRRQKCGEQKPKCASCIRHSTDCLYHPIERVDRRNKRDRQRPLPGTLVGCHSVVPKSPPSISPSRDLNIEDLELLHHYMTSTSVTTAELPQATVQMQNTVPQLAQQHQYVMRNILAQAAIHLSWLRPSQNTHYTLLAAKHHSAALPDFRTALEHMDENNHRALILYSKGLVWCAFAGYQPFPDPEQTASRATDINWLPSWFQLLRGSCLIVECCKPWIRSGLYLLPPPLDDLTDFSSSFDNRRVSELISQLVPLIGSPICEAVLSALHEAFARASMRHHNTPLRNAMNFWVGAISNEYLDLLQRGEPWALVIMAHFCILVFRSETRWFMRGHAAKLLQSIVERLPDPWKSYVEWPREEVGFESSSTGPK